MLCCVLKGNAISFSKQGIRLPNICKKCICNEKATSVFCSVYTNSLLANYVTSIKLVYCLN